MAIAKNVLLSKGRFGKPKETLLTPKTVWTPNVLTIETALTVSITSFCWAEAVKTKTVNNNVFFINAIFFCFINDFFSDFKSLL